MPRIARKYINAKFMHVVAKGIKSEFIFYKEQYKNEYISLLKKYIKEIEKIRIISYCIMDNHVHILIYAEDINSLSCFMKKLNTAYAIYYNQNEDREGYVFSNRYYTQIIEDQKHLIACIKYIHQNPVKAGIVKEENQYKYSSSDKENQGIIDLKILENIYGENILKCQYRIDDEEYEFIEPEKERFDTKNIEDKVEEFCEKYKTSLREIKASNYLILKFKEYLNFKYKVSNKNICAILGIGKNRISVIEKNKRSINN